MAIDGWFYHGVGDREVFERICAGEDVLRLAAHKSDPGDLGRGLYLTSSIHEAEMYGHGGVLLVHAHLQNALRLNFKDERASARAWVDRMDEKFGSPVTGRRREMTLAYDAWEDGGEVGPEPPLPRTFLRDRLSAAEAWRRDLLGSGIDGLAVVGWDLAPGLVLFEPERQVLEVKCLRPRRR
jgi:hypothetical protein